jgi:peptide/nickel transport system substrate-binding protein
VKTTTIAACLLSAACLLVAGCTRVAPQSNVARSGAHNPWTIPGVVRVGFFEDLDNLNPLLSLQSYVGDVEEMIFSGLVQYDNHYRLIPDAASQVPSLTNGGISKDGRTITYHLRPGIRFSDGAPLTSADVTYTWEQALNPLNDTPNREPAQEVQSIDTPNPLTVVVHLKAPYAPFVSDFLRNGYTPAGGILPRHLLRRYRDLNRIAYDNHPVGSGPFQVVSWQPGNALLLAPNPYYFRGAPKIHRIIIRIIPNQNSLLTMLETHELDIYYNLPEAQYATATSIDGYRVSDEATFSLEHVKFNCGRPPLNDVRVRRAVAYAIDWHRLFEDVYLGLGVPGMTDVRPDSWAYNPQAAQYPFDPGRARAILQQAGWRPGPGGILQKNGKPLRLDLVTVVGTSVRLKAEELIQQDLAAAGIDAEIHNYPANIVFAPWAEHGLLTRGSYDLAIVTMDLEPDPNDEINLSPDQIPPAGQNRSFWVDPQVGAWEAAALRTYDVRIRRHYYRLVQQAIHDQLPFHGIEWRPVLSAVNRDLRGYRPGSNSDFWNTYAWSI